MPFDSLVLSAVTRELGAALLGGHVQKIYQPHEREVHLHLRSQGKTRRLLISADARFARVCLTDMTPANPQTPPGFCMALRKHLEGSHLTAVAQIDFDRVLHFTFEYGDGTEKRLIVELMGQHSNVILVDSGDVILDSIKRIPLRISRVREVLPGRHYFPPPGPERADPLTVDPTTLEPPGVEEMVGWLQGRFRGMSGWLAGEIVSRAEASSFVEAWRQIFDPAKAGSFDPTLLLNDANQPVDYFGLPSIQFPPNRQRRAESMNHAVDEVAEGLTVSTGLEQSRQALARAISAMLKTLEAKRKDAQKGLAEADRAEEYRVMGELLVSNLHAVQKGAREVELANYYDPEAQPLKIPLDPRLSPKENADAYFRRQRKARESREELEKRLVSLGEQIYDLKVAQLAAPEKKELAEIEALRQGLVERGLLLRPQALPEKPAKGSPMPRIRRITTPEGWEILVGESAEANDYVTTKMASPADLWFHARAVAGAHVILRTAGKPPGQIPPAVIREAARLAAAGSEARHSSLVPVDYTQRRYVRKPRGSAPGNVLYQNEKTLNVEPK